MHPWYCKTHVNLKALELIIFGPHGEVVLHCESGNVIRLCENAKLVGLALRLHEVGVLIEAARWISFKMSPFRLV